MRARFDGVERLVRPDGRTNRRRRIAALGFAGISDYREALVRADDGCYLQRAATRIRNIEQNRFAVGLQVLAVA